MSRSQRPIGGSRPKRRLTMAQRRARTFRGLAALLLIVVIAVVSQVVTSGSKPNPTAPAVVHYSVGVASCTFVDTTRSTPNYVTSTSKLDRVLVTEIRYPTLSPRPGTKETQGAHPAVGHGPFPLIVFGHGYRLTPDTYAKLLDRWVTAGFIVAAPKFPDTNQQAVTQVGTADEFLPEADDINQPGDMAFLTKSMIQADRPSSTLCPVAHHLVATNKIALAGQSDGATTAVALGFDPKYGVKGVHYRAVVDLSGELFGAGSQTPDTLVVPANNPALFVAQSATDTCNPPQFSTAIYNGVKTTKKWFLKINDAHHLPPYIGTATSAFNIVASTTSKFLANAFGTKLVGKSLMRLGNAHPGVATLTTGQKAPAIAPLTQASGSCYLTS